MFSFQGTHFEFPKKFNEISYSYGISVNFLKKKWWSRTRFPAGKPRRLQQSTGLLPRAAFRVHFGVWPFRTQLPRSWLLFRFLLEVVGQNGLEPSTSRLSVVCSSQLSYWPMSSKSNPQLTHFTQALNARLWLCFSSPHQTRFAGLCWSPHFFGGEYRDRTGDLLLARQALSQLS